MATLLLKIVTPEKLTYSDQVDMVVIPAIEGEMGIMPMHIPLMTAMVPGELVLKQGGTESHLAVGEGFVEITGDSVTVLTDMAVTGENIDATKVQEAMDRAQTRLKEGALEGEDQALLEATISRSLAQLKVKRRNRS